MQYNLAQSAWLQPYVKLAQCNIELWYKFSSSPEVMSEANRSLQTFMEQAQASALQLGQSHAFTSLVQGLIKNYTEFVSDLSQSAYSMMSQGQATWIQQAQEAANNVYDVTAGRPRRAA